MKIVVAVTGASGTVIAKRLLENLKGHKVQLIISEGAKQVAKHEKADIRSMTRLVSRTWDEKDMSSELASSSNIIDAMVIVPSSMKTMSAVANGFADNLITRCAENALKMGSLLVIVPRDTPLSLAAIENMLKLKLAGAIILPPNVSYYTKPRTIEDVTDFVVGKIMDCMRLDHDLYPRWSHKKGD